jgi:hypothetical protein
MNKVLFFVAFITLASCSESTEGKYKLREELRILENTKSQEESNLSGMRADLEVEYDRLSNIKQPKLLRLPRERENQIRNQVLQIEDTESRIAILQDKLIKTNSKISKIKQQLEPYE